VIHEALRQATGGVLAGLAPGSEGIPSRAFDGVLDLLGSGAQASGVVHLGIRAAGGPRLQVELRYGRLRLCASEAPTLAAAQEVALPLSGGVARCLDWEIRALPSPVDLRADAGGAGGGVLDGREERVDAGAVRAAGLLRVRGRRQGDRVWPLGAAGSKKLKEFLRERRVWPSERDRVPLIVAGESIVWVVEHRIDHRFRVRPGTKEVLVLKAARPAATPPASPAS
jgi:tRNA(Ile)-lysidine synthetase-like protein